jgi:hypothetical protein
MAFIWNFKNLPLIMEEIFLRGAQSVRKMSSIPQDRMKVVTKPIFKKHDCHKHESFRAISLLCAA